jgi:hypothetical protein
MEGEAEVKVVLKSEHPVSAVSEVFESLALIAPEARVEP